MSCKFYEIANQRTNLSRGWSLCLTLFAVLSVQCQVCQTKEQYLDKKFVKANLNTCKMKLKLGLATLLQSLF